MAAAVTTLRSTLATALANPGVWSVSAFPPPMPVADSVVIDVDTPYIIASNGVQDLLSPLANFKIICYVPSLDNAGNLQGVETMMVAVWNKLATSGISIRAQSISLGHFAGPSGELTAAEISLSILTTWS